MYQVDQKTVYSISGGSSVISCYMLVGFDTNGLNISWNWTFKDTLISSGSKYKFESKNNYSTVTIDSVSLDDSGAYVCQGTNIYGTYKRSINLFVKSKPIFNNKKVFRVLFFLANDTIMNFLFWHKKAT